MKLLRSCSQNKVHLRSVINKKKTKVDVTRYTFLFDNVGFAFRNTDYQVNYS